MNIERLTTPHAGETGRRTGSKSYVYLLTVLLVCSVIINVLLARKIKHLRYIEATLKAEAQLQPDTIVPALEAKSLDGSTISFPYGDSEPPLVIYVLSPTCTWCIRNQSNVESLAKSVSTKYRFVALSLTSDGLKQYVEKNKITFPVYAGLAERIVSSYKFGGTPQTIIVSSQGKVLKNWGGAYDGALRKEIEKYFSIELPGLTQTEQ